MNQSMYCKNNILLGNISALPHRNTPRGVLGGRNPSLLEEKAMLLMADIVKQLSNDNIHSSSNQ